MPVLAGGFTLQTGVSIDDRYIISASNERFNFNSTLLYEGLTTYSTGSQRYFLFVSASTYDTNASSSSWREFIITEPGSGDVNISGSLNISQSLTIAGIGDVSSSLSEAIKSSGDLQTVLGRGASTDLVITSSAGIILKDIFAPTGSDASLSAFPKGRFNFSEASNFKIADISNLNTNTFITGGLAISGGNSATSYADPANSPALTVLNQGSLVFNRIRTDGSNSSPFALVLKFSSVANSNRLIITGSISASNGITSPTAQFSTSTLSPSYIIGTGTDAANPKFTTHTVSSDNFIALSGSGALLENQSSFPEPVLGGLMVKGGVLYVGVD